MVMRFIFKLSRRQRALVATRVTKSVILSRTIQLTEFLAIFSLRFFSCRLRIICARVATHVMFTARWRRDNFQKKWYHHLSSSSGLRPALAVCSYNARGLRHDCVRMQWDILTAFAFLVSSLVFLKITSRVLLVYNPTKHSARFLFFFY